MLNIIYYILCIVYLCIVRCQVFSHILTNSLQMSEAVGQSLFTRVSLALVANHTLEKQVGHLKLILLNTEALSDAKI